MVMMMMNKVTLKTAQSLWWTQTMGGDFLAKGRQDCSKGIYVLAGAYNITLGLVTALMQWQVQCCLFIEQEAQLSQRPRDS